MVFLSWKKKKERSAKRNGEDLIVGVLVFSLKVYTSIKKKSLENNAAKLMLDNIQLMLYSVAIFSRDA